MLLSRLPVAGHGLLHLEGRVLVDGKARLGQGKQGHPPGLAQAQGTLDIAREEHGLDGRAIRVFRGQERPQLLVDA